MAAPAREEFKDLGFGSVLSAEGGRLLNRDGSFNVVREGLHPLRSLSVYHYLLTVTWTKFILWVCLGYATANALFAAGYVLCGPNALAGTDGVVPASPYFTAFFFSVETLATIGYGHVAPNGLPANLLMTFEALTGLLSFALASGLVFARFSRPVAWIVYSRRALVAPYRGGTALMFRIANGRSNQLIEVSAKMSAGIGRDGARRFHDLALERDRVVLFPLSWTIVHPIDESSPLRGMTEEELRESDAEFFVTLQAIDETFSQQVHSRTSYKPDEVVWGAKFADVFVRRAGRPLGIDLSRLHDFRPVELPSPPRLAALSPAPGPAEPAGA
jgi:inward rectifier potassium channel